MPSRPLDLAKPVFGRSDGPLGLVELEVLVRTQARYHLGELLVGVGGLGAGARDDERGPGLVDQDRVDLVDDGEVVTTLNAVPGRHHHVVAQVVEAELGVGAVGDVGRVGGDARGRVHLGLDHAHVHAEEAVDAAHPLAVALGQVVVDGDHVHALARQRVEVARERGDERLAFAGLHLGDLPGVEHHAADELHVEVAHAERAHGRLTHDGERLLEQVIERLAVLESRAELDRLGGELRVRERLQSPARAR